MTPARHVGTLPRVPRSAREAALRGVVAALLAVTLAAGPSQAQRGASLAPTPLLRTDVLLDRGTTLHAGAGLVVPAGYQARVSLEGGVGATRRDDAWRPSARLDVVARFLVDPFRQLRWAPTVGAGAGMRWERDARPRPVAIVVVGLQGPAEGRTWLRGLEVGLGGGVRIGATLARPRPGRR